MTRHLVERFEVELALERPDARLQDDARLAALMKDVLLPVMDEVFAAHDQPGSVLALPSLVLDLGSISGHRVEEQLAAGLRRVLDEALLGLHVHPDSPARHLDEAAVPGRGLAAPAAPGATRRSVADNELGQLADFLATGQLAWHAARDRGLAHVELLERLLVQHRTGSVELGRMLAQALRHPDRARRLVRQFPRAQLMEIVEGCAPAHADALLAALAMAEGGDAAVPSAAVPAANLPGSAFSSSSTDVCADTAVPVDAASAILGSAPGDTDVSPDTGVSVDVASAIDSPASGDTGVRIGTRACAVTGASGDTGPSTDTGARPSGIGKSGADLVGLLDDLLASPGEGMRQLVATALSRDDWTGHVVARLPERQLACIVRHLMPGSAREVLELVARLRRRAVRQGIAPDRFALAAWPAVLGAAIGVTHAGTGVAGLGIAIGTALGFVTRPLPAGLGGEHPGDRAGAPDTADTARIPASDVNPDAVTGPALAMPGSPGASGLTTGAARPLPPRQLPAAVAVGSPGVPGAVPSVPQYPALREVAEAAVPAAGSDVPARALAAVRALLQASPMPDDAREAEAHVRLLDALLAGPDPALRILLADVVRNPVMMKRFVRRFPVRQLAAMARRCAPQGGDGPEVVAERLAAIAATFGVGSADCPLAIWPVMLAAAMKASRRPQAGSEALQERAVSGRRPGRLSSAMGGCGRAMRKRMREDPERLFARVLPEAPAALVRRLRAAARTAGQGAQRLEQLEWQCRQAAQQGCGLPGALPTGVALPGFVDDKDSVRYGDDRAALGRLVATAADTAAGAACVRKAVWLPVLADAVRTAARRRRTEPGASDPPAAAAAGEGDCAALHGIALFLRTGRIVGAALEPGTHVRLLDTLLDAPGHALAPVLTDALRCPGALQRLVRQFPERQLQAIARRCAPVHGEVLGELARRLTAAAGDFGVPSSVGMLAAWSTVLEACVCTPGWAGDDCEDAALPGLLAAASERLAQLMEQTADPAAIDRLRPHIGLPGEAALAASAWPEDVRHAGAAYVLAAAAPERMLEDLVQPVARLLPVAPAALVNRVRRAARQAGQPAPGLQLLTKRCWQAVLDVLGRPGGSTMPTGVPPVAPGDDVTDCTTTDPAANAIPGAAREQVLDFLRMGRLPGPGAGSGMPVAAFAGGLDEVLDDAPDRTFWRLLADVLDQHDAMRRLIAHCPERQLRAIVGAALPGEGEDVLRRAGEDFLRRAGEAGMRKPDTDAMQVREAAWAPVVRAAVHAAAGRGNDGGGSLAPASEQGTAPRLRFLAGKPVPRRPSWRGLPAGLTLAHAVDGLLAAVTGEGEGDRPGCAALATGRRAQRVAAALHGHGGLVCWLVSECGTLEQLARKAPLQDAAALARDIRAGTPLPAHGSLDVATLRQLIETCAPQGDHRAMVIESIGSAAVRCGHEAIFLHGVVRALLAGTMLDLGAIAAGVAEEGAAATLRQAIVQALRAPAGEPPPAAWKALLATGPGKASRAARICMANGHLRHVLAHRMPSGMLLELLQVAAPTVAPVLESMLALAGPFAQAAGPGWRGVLCRGALAAALSPLPEAALAGQVLHLAADGDAPLGARLRAAWQHNQQARQGQQGQRGRDGTGGTAPAALPVAAPVALPLPSPHSPPRPLAPPPAPSRPTLAPPPRRDGPWPAAWSAHGLEKGARLSLANAGMALAAPYLPRLFGMLGLVDEGHFLDTAAAERAAHLLQWLVCGDAVTPEYQLPLNKLLCGVALDQPVPAGIDITETERDTIDSLLKAMIANWNALGSTSVDGLRQTFLMRRGELVLDGDSWRLAVAQGPFDVLMDKLPWGFSMVKFGWMPLPLHVTWR